MTPSARHQIVVAVALAMAAAAPGLGMAQVRTADVRLELAMIARAPAIVDATVSRLDVVDGGPDGLAGLYTRATLRMHHYDVGRGRAAPTEIWYPGGRLGRRLRVISHGPTLHVGQRVLAGLQPQGSTWLLASAALVRGLPDVTSTNYLWAQLMELRPQ